jgi:hypothetical protein
VRTFESGERKTGVVRGWSVYDLAQVRGFEHVRSLDEIISKDRLEELERAEGELSESAGPT